MKGGKDCFVLNTGASIPAVGLGTWQTDGDLCKAAVKTALDIGYRHLDCAHLYGNEGEVGQAITDLVQKVKSEEGRSLCDL